MSSFEQGIPPIEKEAPAQGNVSKTPDRKQINRLKSERRGATEKLERGGAQRVMDSKGKEVLVPTEEQQEAIRKEHDDAAQLLTRLESQDFNQAYQKIHEEVEEYSESFKQYDHDIDNDPVIRDDLDRQIGVLIRDLRIFLEGVGLYEERNSLDLWILELEIFNTTHKYIHRDDRSKMSGWLLYHELDSSYVKKIPSLVKSARANKIKELRKVLGKE